MEPLNEGLGTGHFILKVCPSLRGFVWSVLNNRGSTIKRLLCYYSVSVPLKSHNAWDVGEMVDRDYDWTVFTKDSLYGVPTPHDNSGSQARDSLHWLSLDQRLASTIHVCAVKPLNKRTHF